MAFAGSRPAILSKAATPWLHAPARILRKPCSTKMRLFSSSFTILLFTHFYLKICPKLFQLT